MIPCLLQNTIKFLLQKSVHMMLMLSRKKPKAETNFPTTAEMTLNSHHIVWYGPYVLKQSSSTMPPTLAIYILVGVSFFSSSASIPIPNILAPMESSLTLTSPSNGKAVTTLTTSPTSLSEMSGYLVFATYSDFVIGMLLPGMVGSMIQQSLSHLEPDFQPDIQPRLQ
jgi:hypothetical protein